MARNTRHFFTVEGSGRFPFDMLRYDHCWPLTETNDSLQLHLDYDGDLRRVVLATDSPNAPTIGRWESFGWRVVALFEAREDHYKTPPQGVQPWGRVR